MIGYRAAHQRVERFRGKPKYCTQCELNDTSRRYEWANLTGNYEDPWDYVRLCVRCHRIKDGTNMNKPLKIGLHWHDYIRKMYESGTTQDDLALRFSTSQAIISKIINRQFVRS